MSPQFFVLTTFLVLMATVVLSFWQDRRVTREEPPAGDFVETDQGRVHLITRGEDHGTQLPVVMLHGSFANGLDMDLDLAGSLAPHRQVLIPDRPGHGFSGRPDGGYRLDVQVAAMRDAIRAQGHERYVVLGQSYGAAAALVWALAYPEDVAGVVLIAPVSHPWPYGLRWYIRVANNPRYGWLFRRTFMALFARYGLQKASERALKGCRAQPYYFDRTRVALGFRAQEFLWNAQDICRLYEQLVPSRKLYPQLDVPVEIVAGTHDLTVLLPIHASKLAEEIPGCGFDVVEGGGHALHHSHPERCLDALKRVDERLEMAARSPLESALRAIGAVFPQRSAGKEPEREAL